MRNGLSDSAKLKNPNETPKSKKSKGGKQHVVAKTAVKKRCKDAWHLFFHLKFFLRDKTVTKGSWSVVV